jgi:hypothetical protein
LENLPMEFEKLQSLVELHLSCCSNLASFPNSIMAFSQLKTFRLSKCPKLENLPTEFGKHQWRCSSPGLATRAKRLARLRANRDLSI